MDITAYAHHDVLYWLQTYASKPAGLSPTPPMTSLTASTSSSPRMFRDQTSVRIPGTWTLECQMVSTGVGVPRLRKIKVASGRNDVFRNPQSVPVVETM